VITRHVAGRAPVVRFVPVEVESAVRMIQHALSGAVYEWAEDDVGPVQVTDKRGRQGRFDRNGRWVLGELRVADPELCRWIESGGPKPGGAAARSRRFETEETFS
jgi:hypothetical protein